VICVAWRLAGIATLTLAMAMLPGCNRDQALGERLVRAYNDAAMAAYAAGDFSRLAEVAGSAEQRKVQALVDFKTGAGVRLESRLEKLDVTGVSHPKPDQLLVSTTERWRYHDRPVQPGRPSGPELKATMKLTYDFRREAGSWKLDTVRSVSTEYDGPRPESAHDGQGPSSPH